MSKTAGLMAILIMAGGGVTSILAAFGGAWGEAAALAFVGGGMLVASRVLSAPKPDPDQVKVPAAQARKAELA